MTTHLELRRAMAVLLVAALTAPIAAAAAETEIITAPVAGDLTLDGRVFVGGVRRQDEIVLINVRPVCGTCDPHALRTGIRVERYAVYDEVGYRRWQPSNLESFLAFDPTVPTVILVHGNQITEAGAKQAGFELYRRMMHYAGDGPSMRLVIFSWPSAKAALMLLRDVRVKAARTGAAGCQLAWLLDQMPVETPITLVGFSFGARIVTGGLHILAGGNLGHLSLYERAHPDRPPMNVVLISAALHANWLGEGQYHGLAMTQVNRMQLINNCGDPAMRLYHLAFDGRPQALGLRGPTYMSPWERSKIEMRDVSRHVSRHLLSQYLCAPGVGAQIADSALAAPQGETKVALAK